MEQRQLEQRQRDDFIEAMHTFMKDNQLETLTLTAQRSNPSKPWQCRFEGAPTGRPKARWRGPLTDRRLIELLTEGWDTRVRTVVCKLREEGVAGTPNVRPGIVVTYDTFARREQHL